MIGFIYPKWLRAKGRLLDSLVDIGIGVKQKSQIYDTVDNFFRHHFFEVGFSIKVPHEDFYRGDKEEMEKHIRYQAARELAKHIVDKDMIVTKTEYHSNDKWTFPNKEIHFTVLVVACPDMVGPGTREAKILQMEKQSKETT